MEDEEIIKSYQSMLKADMYLFIVVIIVLAVLAVLIYNEDKSREIDCNNITSLNEDVHCMVENVSNFFIYNMSNKNRDINFQQLEKEGGVCYQWAEYYINMSIKKGYLAKEVSFYMTENSSHSVALVSTNGSYCIIDQESYKCFTTG